MTGTLHLLVSSLLLVLLLLVSHRPQQQIQAFKFSAGTGGCRQIIRNRLPAYQSRVSSTDAGKVGDAKLRWSAHRQKHISWNYCSVDRSRQSIVRFATAADGPPTIDNKDEDGSDNNGVISNRNTITSSSSNKEEDLVHTALATHTTATSPLLGIKSIGVDYGLVRTGLAATIGYDMRPLGITSNLNDTELCHEIISMVRNEGAKRIVVGLPLHKNGTESARSNITRQFATELAGAVLGSFGDRQDDGNFDGVYLWDERYTSREAKARIMMANANRAKDSAIRSEDDLDGTIDDHAACLILEHYYKNSGVDAELVEVPEGEVRDACLVAWDVEKQRQEDAKRKVVRKREEALNARDIMIARVKAMEAEAEMGASSTGSKTKKGKKKKRKKKK